MFDKVDGDAIMVPGDVMLEGALEDNVTLQQVGPYRGWNKDGTELDRDRHTVYILPPYVKELPPHDTYLIFTGAVATQIALVMVINKYLTQYPFNNKAHLSSDESDNYHLVWEVRLLSYH